MFLGLPFTASLGFEINLFVISSHIFFETLVNESLDQNRQCLFSDDPNVYKGNEAIQICSEQEASVNI